MTTRLEYQYSLKVFPSTNWMYFIACSPEILKIAASFEGTPQIFSTCITNFIVIKAVGNNITHSRVPGALKGLILPVTALF